MSAETCNTMLKDTLNEMEKVCPEISNSFIFKESGQVLAKDNNTDEIAVNSVIDTFSSLSSKSSFMGNVESVAFSGTLRKATISKIENVYFVTLSSREADDKTLRVITRVLIPLIMKTMDVVQPIQEKAEVMPTAIPTTIVTEEKSNEPEKTAPIVVRTSVLADSPATQQLIVENPGKFDLVGFRVNQDMARVDNSVINRWKKAYGDKIEEIQIEETRTGKRLRCRFKPVKDQNLEGKGIIQLPEKTQQKLQTKKGALVIVRPIIEDEEVEE